MLLAVDTSTPQVGLALYDGAQVIAEYTWRSSRRHTVELAPAISELLIRCGSTMDDVHALGVALGPGSFTSLRVGLALVKGLALYESSHVKESGVTFPVEVNIKAVSLGGTEYLLAVCRDITERKRAEEWHQTSSAPPRTAFS